MPAGAPSKYTIDKAKDICEIYALHCPDTNEVKYIGKAKDSLKRLKSHISDSKRRSTPVYNWIRNLSENGKEPVITVICKTDNWVKEEIAQIAHFKSLGFCSLNVAKGGNQPFCPPETRASNGRKSAAIRDHYKWKLRHQFGQCMRFLRDKFPVKYNQLAARINSAGVGLHYELKIIQ